MTAWSASVSTEGWRKGPWTPEEDKLLSAYINSHGEGRWSSVSRSAGLNRSGKSCRLRWVNYLRPGLKRGHITPQEEGIIIELHALWGNKWSTIARYLPGRTDNEIKNYWRTHFKKTRKPSDKQEKRKSRRQNNQMPEVNASVSPQSEVISSDQKLMSLPPQAAADHRPETHSAYPNMENQCFPATYNDDSTWSDTVPFDGLWGWLWNLDDQNGRGGQMAAGDFGKMAFQNEANVYNGGYIY